MYSDFRPLGARLLLGVTILVSGIAFFETTAVNVATSAIQREFSANITLIQWAINSYNLMLGVFILIMGSLSDRFGHKRLTLFGMAIFTAATALCGLTNNVWVFITARVMQGLGGAMMIPQSIAIINSSFRENVRGTALGVWGGFSGMMTIIGPFISGAIIDMASWHWTFLVIVPFGIASIVLIQKAVPETTVLKKAPIDWASVLLLTTGLFSLSWGLIQSSSHAWEDPEIIGSIVIGILLLCAFGWWQKPAKHPLIDLRVMLRRDILLANLYTFQLYSVISAIAFYAVIFFQQVAGYSATMSGLAIMPVPITIALLSVFAGRIADTYGARMPMVIGACLVTAGLLFLLGVGVDARYWIEIFPGMLLIGLGFGIFIPSLTKTALNVPPELSGTASGVNNSISRIAGLIGVAILGTALAVGYHAFLRRDLSRLNLDALVMEQVLSQSTRLMQIDLTGIPMELQTQIREQMRESFLEAYQIQLMLCAILSGSGAVSAWFIRKVKLE